MQTWPLNGKIRPHMIFPFGRRSQFLPQFDQDVNLFRADTFNLLLVVFGKVLLFENSRFFQPLHIGFSRHDRPPVVSTAPFLTWTTFNHMPGKTTQLSDCEKYIRIYHDSRLQKKRLRGNTRVQDPARGAAGKAARRSGQPNHARPTMPALGSARLRQLRARLFLNYFRFADLGTARKRLI